MCYSFFFVLLGQGSLVREPEVAKRCPIKDFCDQIWLNFCITCQQRVKDDVDQKFIFSCQLVKSTRVKRPTQSGLAWLLLRERQLAKQLTSGALVEVACDELKDNKTLHELTFGCIDFNGNAISSICRGLESNENLSSLIFCFLSFVFLFFSKKKFIFFYIFEDSSEINEDGAKVFSKGLEVNTSLKNLRFSLSITLQLYL